MSKLKQILNKIGKETVELIKKEIIHVDAIRTHNLFNSIGYSVTENGDEFDLDFEEIYYGEFVDEGTRYIKPRYFFNRIIERQMKKYEDDILDAAASDQMDEINKNLNTI